MSRIFCAVATLAIVVDQCSAALLLKESMLKREDFVIKSKPVSSVEHEVVFAIKQKNLDVLESMVLERATPGNALYQKWMTFSEVGELIKNEEAASAVLSWLSANGIKVC